MENFNEIYSTYHKKILNQIAFKINDKNIVEELTNDVFMKVYEHLDNFDPSISAMSTWINNIAKNKIIDYYRKPKKLTLSIDIEFNDTGKTVSDILPSTINQHNEMVTDETISLIKNSFSFLNHKYKDIAIMLFNEESSYAEISKRLNIPLSTVKVRINRLKLKLSKNSKLKNLYYENH